MRLHLNSKPVIHLSLLWQIMSEELLNPRDCLFPMTNVHDSIFMVYVSHSTAIKIISAVMEQTLFLASPKGRSPHLKNYIRVCIINTIIWPGDTKCSLNVSFPVSRNYQQLAIPNKSNDCLRHQHLLVVVKKDANECKNIPSNDTVLQLPSAENKHSLWIQRRIALTTTSKLWVKIVCSQMH